MKIIEHKKYTAPQISRFKVEGKWVIKKKRAKPREFEQTIWVLRTHRPARRYLPLTESPLGKTFPQFDSLVRNLIAQGEKNPSTMAKRKFHLHRPKPANNTAKNRARRHSLDLILGAAIPGNRPEVRPITNAASVRHNFLLKGQIDPRIMRSITGDRRSSRRQYSDHGAQSERECSRRRRQGAWLNETAPHQRVA